MMLRPLFGLVVEDVDDVRTDFGVLLGNIFPGIALKYAQNLAEARACLAEVAPDTPFVALVDLGLPDGCGTDLIRDMADRFPAAMSIVLSIYDDDTHLFGALSAGASGYLLKSEDQATLVNCLARIQKGEPPLSPPLARRILGHFKQAALPQKEEKAPEPALTVRENEVLGMLGLGMRVSEVANELGLSDHTVGDHIKSIYRKLNIGSRAEAAVHAVRRGLV